jgi:hypothetical protein
MYLIYLGIYGIGWIYLAIYGIGWIPEGEDDRRQIIPFLIDPFLLDTESRATQRGAPRAPPLHPSSSSSPMRGRLHRRRDNLRISTELTPY